MGLFSEAELIIPTKKQIKNDKSVKAKSLNGYDAIREKIDEDNTLTVKKPAVAEKPKQKVSIGL